MSNSHILNKILIDWGSDNSSDYNNINVNPEDILNNRDLYTVMNNPTFKECCTFFKDCCTMYTEIIEYILKNVMGKNSNLSSYELSDYIEFILGDPAKLIFFNSGKPDWDTYFPDDSFALNLDDVRLNDGEFNRAQEKCIQEFITNFNKCPIIRIQLHHRIKGSEFFGNFFHDFLSYNNLKSKFNDNILVHIHDFKNNNGDYIIDIDSGAGNSGSLYGCPESKWSKRNINKKALLERCKAFLNVFYKEIIYKLECDFC